MRSTTYHVPGLVLTDHELDVPLDHGRPDGERITVFAREVADPQGRDRPFLVFQQGGPGNRVIQTDGDLDDDALGVRLGLRRIDGRDDGHGR